MSTNGSVNITDAPFNAVGDKVHDDTAAIQQAIDYAIANRIGTVVLPTGGDWRITQPIFADDPRNLRTSLTAPPFTQSFALALVGAEGPALGSGAATIWADFNDQVALWVGPGRGMAVKGIAVSGPPATTAGFRRGLPASGVGIGIASNGSQALIENSSVNLFHKGIVTGANGVDQLCDATTIRKCNITAAVGVHFSRTNNLINVIEDSVIDAVVAVQAEDWNGVNVRGGNFSTNLTGNSFPISGTQVATLQQGGGQTAY